MPTSTWVFDVDGCLIDSLSGGSLRPGAPELLERLKRSGAAILLWSAGGDEYARRKAHQHGIGWAFDGYYSKDSRDERGHYRTDHLPLDDHSVTFVDDQPSDLDPGLSVIAVRPYLAHSRHDTGLAVLAEAVQDRTGPARSDALYAPGAVQPREARS